MLGQHITLKANCIQHDKQSDTYTVELSDADLVSHDKEKHILSFKISSKMVQFLKDRQMTQMTTKCETELSDILDDDQMEFLLDEIAMENDHQSRRDSKSKINNNHQTILSEIISEWNLNFNPQKTNKTDSKPTKSISMIECTGCHKTCKPSQRIQFILKYYAEWVQYMHDVQMEVDDELGMMPSPSFSCAPSPSNMETLRAKEKIKNVMSQFERISDFFYELTNYSTYDLCNDFEHVLRSHIRIGAESKLKTMTYFEQILGKCNDQNCRCYSRHKRDINVDNMMEDKRKENFFINGDETRKHQQKLSEFKINNEINLQNLLDKIHTCLLHQKNKMFISNSFKYITRMKCKRNSTNTTKAIKAGHDEHDEKQEENVKLSKHTFGSSITYWDPKHHRYCSPKYADLRDELLNNNVYPLSPEMYDNLKSKALHFLNTKAGKALIVQREHDWMKKFKLLRGSPITVDHVIAIYCYCNVPCLQRAYKRYGYNSDGTIAREELMKKHGEIWHYSRLLLEAVHCFGKPLDKKRKYYHGIDTQLIFDRYNVMIDVPLSLTTEKDIAYSFSDVSGISVEFGHGGLSDLQSLCLDLSMFSDFPLEQEYLIFHSFVSVRDLIIKRLHHDQWLSILRFWHRLTEGFFFKHLIDSKAITRNDQLCICAMVQNTILTNKSKKYDHRIPSYMQSLFDVLGGNGFFWIINSEYDGLVPRLKKYLTVNSSPYLTHLESTKQISARCAQTFEWNVNSIDTSQLFVKPHPWIKSDSYKIFINENDYLSFHFECQNKAKSGLFRCRIHLDEKPDYVSKISFGNGLYCPELQFDNYSYGELNSNKLYNMSLHSLFKTSLLRKYSDTGFNLKLQIQLFSIKDKNGAIINIHPHQK